MLNRCGRLAILLLLGFLSCALFADVARAQIAFGGAGYTGGYGFGVPLCNPPSTLRFLMASGSTIAAPSADAVFVAIDMDPDDPNLITLPFNVLITGNPSGRNPPLGLPAVGPGPPGCFFWGPRFVESPAMTAFVEAAAPAIGEWRAFLIPLSPTSLPGGTLDVQAYFQLHHSGTGYQVLSAVNGLASGIITTTAASASQLQSSAVADTTIIFSSQYDVAWETTKMHFPQHADTLGIDIDFTFPKRAADDWVCSKPGPIENMRFWFSAQGDWFNANGDIGAQISHVDIRVRADIKDPDGTGPLVAKPGAVLWSRGYDGLDRLLRIREFATGDQGWYDPQAPQFTPSDHTKIFECRIDSIPAPFVAQIDSVYWLDISIATNDSLAPSLLLGWKTSDLNRYPNGYTGKHFLSDAVWGQSPNPAWANMTFPAGQFVGEGVDLAFVFNLIALPDSMPVCHDDVWDVGEFCGRDAFVTTGLPDMNHDCIIDAIDFHLMTLQFAGAGGNLSGDLNGDGAVNVLDLSILIAAAGNTVGVPSCAGTAPQDQCMGSISISLDADPNAVVNTGTQVPGLNSAQVVVNGWANAQMIDYTIQTSSNVVILSQTVDPSAGGSVSNSCTPDNNTLGTVLSSLTPWSSGPMNIAQINYLLLDASPAWITIAPASGCLSDRVRWLTATADRSYDFNSVKNAGINGPAPSDTPTTCSVVATDVNTPDPLPTIHRLGQNHPNPFNPVTSIEYELATSERVTLAIYDIRGELVRMLVDRSVDVGRHVAIWDGRDSLGDRVGSGVYFYRMSAGTFVEKRKMILIK